MASDLLSLCEEMIKTYNPKRMSVESHADGFLSERKGNSEFIREVFFGVMKHKAALKVFMAIYFRDNFVVRSDYTVYTILTYLLVFRGVDETLFRRFILQALDVEKILTYLDYLQGDLETSGVAAAWMGIFDPDYVHDTLLSGVQRLLEKFQPVIQDLRTVSGGPRLANEPTAKKLTVPVAPKLTKPAPRRVAEPRRILAAPTIPKSASTATMSQRPSTPGDDDVPKHEDEKPQTVKKKPLTKPRGPKLSATSSNMAKLQSEKTQRDDLVVPKKSPPRKTQTTPPPPPQEVKLNTSAILREDAVFRARQREQYEIIKAYEAELRDSSEFLKWQHTMKEQDEQIKFDRVCRTRLLAKASAEEARKAVERNLEENKELAKKQLEETVAMREQRKMDDELTLHEHRYQAEEVRKVRDVAPKKAVEQVLKKKADLGEQVKKEKHQRSLEKQQETEQREKDLAEKVQKLRADFHVKEEYIKEFDPNTAAGLGLLDEMSLFEMQERLRVNKIRNQDFLDQKRDELKEDRMKKKDKLQSRFDTVLEVREKAAERHRQSREAKKQDDMALKEKEDQRQKELMSQLNFELQQKKEANEKRRKELQADEERRAKKNLFLGTGEALREQRITEDLLKAAARADRVRSDAAAYALELETAANAKAAKQAALNKARSVNAQRKLDASRAANVREAKDITLQQQKDDIARKKSMYRTEKNNHLLKSKLLTDPYTDHINQTSIARAREHREALRRVSQHILSDLKA